MLSTKECKRLNGSQLIGYRDLSEAFFNGGTIPLGYDRNPKNKGELVINQEEADTVQKVFTAFLEKESLRKTQVALIEQGIFNKKFTNKHGIERGGKIFTVDTLQSLLTNKTYLGLKDVKHKDGAVETIKAVWPAIISEEVFNKVQERLSKNKNRYKPESWKKYPFPLTELVQCGECGKSLGGKSGTGRTEKHFYYGHPQLKNPLAKAHEHQCQVKNVRAPRLEEIVVSSLKTLLNDPSLIAKWVEIYQSKTTSDLPELQVQSKKLDQEMLTISKRINNLVQRIADLPAEVPADAFYEQIKQMTQKLNDLKLAKENLKTKELDLRSQEIDQEGFTAKIHQVLANLEQAPKELQRPVFTNLVKFIEVHPTKIKMGLYAPVKESMRATGTDGIPGFGHKKSRLESQLFCLNSSTRVGSSTVGIGARGGT